MAGEVRPYAPSAIAAFQIGLNDGVRALLVDIAFVGSEACDGACLFVVTNASVEIDIVPETAEAMKRGHVLGNAQKLKRPILGPIIVR